MVGSLQIKLSTGYGEPVDLAPPGCTVGRASVNDIVVESEDVETFHADIKVTAKNITITDTGTAAGTFVNGRRVITPATLKSGDTIRVGDVELIVENKFGEVKTVELPGAGLLELGAGGWSLLAETGPDIGEKISVIGRMDIGRSSDCDISIFDPGLSRRHAEFVFEDDVLRVRDLESANGTWVNEARVSDRVLEHDDRVRFDKLIFRVIAPQ